ncbi:probable EMI5 Protein required for transcriptional induction of the early meiotic-specific transcription factor IME1, also required for sporulation [Rhynchosporium agropyri]|uniref:Succinate dehydrogenase assembly factor 2, mitochondrial n=1 Tax=Rhynchosporium agropyri TaxID=914238 RepID=A0A1E1KN42_9HELO|nr:probable EMI5 Protein required for transcriptional induction of the early meiotic-specific transcription factor IME1, also required for sporulation [Rhynchosporium agropyri]
MSAIRLAIRSARPSMAFARPISTSARRLAGPGNAQAHEGTEEHRKIQSSKPLNPHMTNTNSTIANEMPSVGVQKAPPELITSVEPDFVPKDSVPENTERMTGGTQSGEPESGKNAEMEVGEMAVGEMEGAKFKVEPLRRTGEDPNTMRARLLYQCRKRGTLESDLLMSTFAEAHLRDMTPAQMSQLDIFLDENDWDIYYWATQEPTPTSQETAEGAAPGPQGATPNASGKDLKPVPPQKGEWAQTIGTFKPAYRPVPARWKNSEVLAMLRRHVISRSAGGIHEADAGVEGEGLARGVQGTGGKGMAFMPPVFQTDQ